MSNNTSIKTIEKADPQTITQEQMEAWLRQEYEGVKYIYENGNILTIERTTGSFYEIGEVHYIQVGYGDMFVHDDSGHVGYMMMQTEYFPRAFTNTAVKAFLQRLHSKYPNQTSGHGMKLDKIAEINKNPHAYEEE